MQLTIASFYDLCRESYARNNYFIVYSSMRIVVSTEKNANAVCSTWFAERTMGCPAAF